MSEVVDLSPEDFLNPEHQSVILDVRSPGEYLQGFIPGGYNLPLFDDDERRQVGTIYRQQGRHPAIKTGLDITGPKLSKFIEQVERFTEQREVRIYCWRGGMRSGSLAWLLNTAGYRVYRLAGGYKAYRRFVLDEFSKPRSIRILSGPTGSGKTAILQALHEMGEQVLDLEGLANHKGSTFGALGESPQPTQQQFENLLAEKLRRLHPDKIVWIEDESQRIGTRMVPQDLWQQMRQAPVCFLEMPRDLRVSRLIEDYGRYSREELEGGILRLQKRLGGSNTDAALKALEKGDLAECCRILLIYYDKTYRYGLSRRNQSLVKAIDTDSIDPEENARLLLKNVRQQYSAPA